MSSKALACATLCRLFSLTNPETNGRPHSMDFHAAETNFLEHYKEVRPGESLQYRFKAKWPGVFAYHCGASPMIQHIARGMMGAIIVDPKDPKAMPKADREYVLVQSELFKDPDDVDAMFDRLGIATVYDFRSPVERIKHPLQVANGVEVVELGMLVASVENLWDMLLAEGLTPAGAEKIITKNGESYVALIDADRLDYYHRLERERIHLLLIDEASKGLDDVAAGRVQDARAALTSIKKRRAV